MNEHNILPRPEANEGDVLAEPLESVQETTAAKALEKNTSSGVDQGLISAAVNDATTAQVNGVAPVPTNTPRVVSSIGSSALPMTADDIDLIEKKWVNKAKEIVDETQGDPFKQNQELHKVKADYIKKRFNKDIDPRGV